MQPSDVHALCSRINNLAFGCWYRRLYILAVYHLLRFLLINLLQSGKVAA